MSDEDGEELKHCLLVAFLEIEKAFEKCTNGFFWMKSKSRERNGSSSKLIQSRRLGFR
jgi:hypothetical protein